MDVILILLEYKQDYITVHKTKICTYTMHIQHKYVVRTLKSITLPESLNWSHDYAYDTRVSNRCEWNASDLTVTYHIFWRPRTKITHIFGSKSTFFLHLNLAELNID